nr:50S ribosomal protein L4P [uncultured archaeon]
MKTQILNLEGKKVKEIEMPKYFSSEIRKDIVAKVLETKKKQQPYAPNLMAGKQHTAKGKMVHRRHVWRSGYGRGQSRVPRKIFSRKGSQFNLEAAEVPFARGGMRAHPPKVIHIINTKKINKKELEMALLSALSATANGKEIAKRYETIKDDVKNAPFVVDKFDKTKTKEILAGLKNILGNDLFELAIKKKSIRAGKGTMRGRKYKSNAGLLIVIGNGETLKFNSVDVKKANSVGVPDLARGGVGRLTLYTESAINELNERFKGK